MSVSIKRTLGIVAAIVAFACLREASAQRENKPRKVSSMQWANASAVEGVKFTLLGDVVADPWRPGGQMGAGQRGTLQWRAEFVSLPGGAVLKESLELTSGESVAGLLVGDFVENKMPASSGQLAPGFSKIGPGKSLRAALLRFPVDRERKSQHPVYLVNADPEKRVKVVVDRTDYDLDYAAPRRFEWVR